MTTTIPATFLDLHIIQTIPLAALNRDGDGNPKSVVIGGVTRARLSPQAIKRPVRQHIEKALPEEAAVRTRRLVHEIRDILLRDHWTPQTPGEATPEEAELATFAALDVFAAASGGMKVGSVEEAAEGAKAKDPLATAALIYTPASTAARLANVAAGLKAEYETALKDASANGGKPKSRSKAKKDEPTTLADPKHMKGWLAEANGSIALLGRTLMEVDGAERDACVQVSSAFTTHEAVIEVDFFVAVDDYAASTPGIPDVGQMGDSQHTAGTFYRYATINLQALITANNGDTDLTRRLTHAFIDGFINTLPDSGQTNAAAWTLPDLVHLAARSDRPVNLSTAFDKPIRGGHTGHATPSTERLAAYAATIQRLTAGRGLVHAVHAHTGTDKLPGLGQATESYEQATDTILDAAFGTQQ
ncbi:type I-E CRISPR-associated protein Cas7/Cse4/CasC [Kitasatospora sp. NPDC059146]|uniref:type I-E CRISPR-associated protein Cas7/Cse4/CasC n=1 Tax=unclassified Kitasatospora TaxID=2633591 RepID=UPI0036C50A28